MKFLALFLAATLAGAAETPKLEFENTNFDFGDAREGDEFAGQFKFRNTGNAVLKLGVPESACGCTHVSVKPDTLQPGESGEVRFTLDLVNIRGPVQKTISIPSNDPEQPVVTLSLTGHAEPVFEIEPELIFFGEVAPGETVRETIRIRRLDGKKLAVGEAEGTREFLRARIETNQFITIEVTGTGKAEPFSDILTVTMQGASKPAFHIPVAGQFLPSIKIEPAALRWELPDPNTERRFLVSSTTTNRPLDIGNFASTLEEVMVKVDELEEGRQFRVSVKLAEWPAESAHGALVFETNFPDRPTVTIPLHIVVPEKNAE